MPLLLLLLILASMVCTTPDSPEATGPTAPFVQRDGHTYAVVQLVDWYEEASGMDGSHWMFRVVGTDDLLYGGGHGMYTTDELLGYAGVTMLHVPSQRRYFVARLVLGAGIPATGDGWPGFGWRNIKDPDLTGSIIALGRANGLDDARARLAEVARTGMLADPVEIRDRSRDS